MAEAAEDVVVDRGDELPADTGEGVIQDDPAKNADGTDKKAEGDDKSVAKAGEEGAEGAEGEEEADTKDTRDRRIRVPKWRLDEANAKARAREESLRAQIEALSTAKTSTAVAETAPTAAEKIEAQIEELESKYDAAIADGEKDKAAAFRRERRQLERTLLTTAIGAAKQEAKNEAAVEMQYTLAIQDAEAVYPELNPDAEEFKPAIADYVALLRDRAVREGVSPATALQRAITDSIKEGFLKAPKSTGTRDETAAAREKAARAAAAKAAAGTPPRTNTVGLDSDKAGAAGGVKSVLHMSQDEFAKLSDDQKAVMRGDVL